MTHLSVAFLMLLWLPLSANAYLGERRAVANGVVKKALVSGSQLRVQSTTSDDLTIKEFIDSTGLVYAIRWEGSTLPDINALLGEYFPEYKLAIATTPHRVPHRRLSADSDNLHISQFGHPGALFGVIYLKNSLPANVQPEDLK